MTRTRAIIFTFILIIGAVLIGIFIAFILAAIMSRPLKFNLSENITMLRAMETSRGFNRIIGRFNRFLF